MKIRIHSNDLNRMMKIIKPCLDTKSITKAVIQVTHENNRLKIRATNSHFSAEASTFLMGGDGETFCVDGPMMSRVASMCSGEIEISADEKTCTVKGTGRTKMPIVSMNIPDIPDVVGKSVKMLADNFKYCHSLVAYAVGSDQNRIQLTGVYVTTDGELMKMVTLDGFQLAIESTNANGDTISAIIPGAFMTWAASVLEAGNQLTLKTDGTKVQIITDEMKLTCPLLNGEYIDYKRLLPKTFETESLVKVGQLRDALKAGNVVNNKQKLVKLQVESDSMTVMNNSEEADFDADISCQTTGSPLKIAFNEAYLMNIMNAIDADEAIMKFNSPVSPVVVQGKDQSGIHLTLPVRIHEVMN